MNRIKELRDNAHLLQDDLAEKLNVKRNTVSSWERGRTEPDFESLRKMAEIFGVSVDYILGGENKMPVGYYSDEQFMVDCTTLSEENRQKVLDFASWLLERQGHGQTP